MFIFILMDEPLNNYVRKEVKKFYSQPLKNRRCSVVVSGGNQVTRENFMRSFRDEIGEEVFVVPIEQYPNPVGEYVIDLDKKQILISNNMINKKAKPQRINKSNFQGRDIVSIDDFSLEEINYILKHAEDIEKNSEKYSNLMSGKMMAPLFFENSTRTFCSFQTAMIKMGGSVLDFDADRSSLKKGETLKDTVKTIEAYGPDVIVVRHNKDGAARFIADEVNIPVINAGDGKNQHPTQTLLDLYTIKQITGSLDRVNIAIAGDLKYGRTPHSLALALARYNACEISFISPESLSMPSDLLDKLGEQGVNFSQHGLDDLEDLIPGLDIVYMTRVQRERFPEGPEGNYEYEKVSNQYCLKIEMLKSVKEDFKIMHPLPKVTEIDSRIDETKYAYYFQQVKNGVYVRKALLSLIL